jgi:hypothetical protein
MNEKGFIPPGHSQTEIWSEKKRGKTLTPGAVHQAEEIVRKYSNCREWELVAAIAEILMEQERLWGLLADGKGTS